MVVTFAGVHRSWRGDINIGVGKQPDGILYYTHEMTVTVADSIAGVTFATSLTEWRNVVGGISVSHIQPNANMIPIVTLKVKYLIRPNLLCLMWQRVPRCQMQLLIWGITGNLHANRTPDANTEMWGTTTTIFTWLGDCCRIDRLGRYDNRFQSRDQTWYRHQIVTENTTEARLIIGKGVTSRKLAERTKNTENSLSNSKSVIATVEHNLGNKSRSLDSSTQTVTSHVKLTTQTVGGCVTRCTQTSTHQVAQSN